MLEVRELCVCELTAALELAQSTVSKHLKILEDAELVESRREGVWVNYHLAVRPDNPYAQVMQQHLREWLADDDRIRQSMSRVDAVDRLKICPA